jgi:hypothetical protein
MKVGQIEKGIPIPKFYGPRASRYPFNEMEVGDSILIEAEKNEDLLRVRGSARSSMRQYGIRHGMKFGAKNEGERGLRIFCIKKGKKIVKY